MIWLLSALGWLRKGFDALLGVATRYPLQCALVLSLAANVWLWLGWGKEQDGREADRAAYVQAQADAKAKQAAADMANVTTQTARNEKLEQAHVELEAARRTAVADYIDRNRLRPQATCRAASAAAQAGVHPDPAAPVEAGSVADMVAVSPTDLDKLASGAVRGAECTGFLNTLVAERLAVPAP